MFLLLLAACGNRYECCVNGVVEQCTCSRGIWPWGDKVCIEVPYEDLGDGTCCVGAACPTDTGDTAR